MSLSAVARSGLHERCLPVGLELALHHYDVADPGAAGDARWRRRCCGPRPSTPVMTWGERAVMRLPPARARRERLNGAPDDAVSIHHSDSPQARLTREASPSTAPPYSGCSHGPWLRGRSWTRMR